MSPRLHETLSADLDALLRVRARPRRIGRKEHLFLSGSPPDALFHVEHGLVRLGVTGASGREAVLGLATPGVWFGEASLFSGEARGHDALAVVDSELLEVPAATVHALVDSRPEYLLQFLRLMARRYRSTLQRMDQSVLEPLPQRLACRLLEAHHDDPRTATIRLSQEELGHMLGVSRQSVNKVLGRWETDGILRVAYRTLLLLQPRRLEALALGDA